LRKRVEKNYILGCTPQTKSLKKQEVRSEGTGEKERERKERYRPIDEKKKGGYVE